MQSCKVPAAVPAGREWRQRDQLRTAVGAADGGGDRLRCGVGSAGGSHGPLPGVPDRRHAGHAGRLRAASTMGVGTSLAVAGVWMLIVGAGIGLVMQVLVIAAQNAVDYRDLGVATSTVAFFRSLGGALGVALFGTILANQLTANLAADLHGLGSGIDLSTIRQSPDRIAALPPEVHTAVVGSVRRRTARRLPERDPVRDRRCAAGLAARGAPAARDRAHPDAGRRRRVALRDAAACRLRA